MEIATELIMLILFIFFGVRIPDQPVDNIQLLHRTCRETYEGSQLKEQASPCTENLAFIFYVKIKYLRIVV